MAPHVSESSNSCFTLTLHIPIGQYLYKFLVDGVWTVDHTSLHPVRISPDGVRQHILTVHAIVTMEGGRGGVTNVFRSASASAVDGGTRGIPGPSSSTSLHEVARREVELAPRGSSFNAGMGGGGYSTSVQMSRKSLLARVGSGWMKRFSSRVDEIERSTERGVSGVFRSGVGKASLFPSQSEPNVGVWSVENKENSFRKNIGTPDRAKRGTIRGSGRGVVGRPIQVDVPKDMDEVDKQADNWRSMAKHLQEDLFDPSGARKLFLKAIEHRESHGMWCSSQNAQVHVDLARNLSKAECMSEAERHLREALKIYNHIEAGVEHIADLLLYVGVVVDRQKRRLEAEALYRQALDLYHKNEIEGNNFEIALKNLSLNLRKQNREADLDGIRREYMSYKGSSVIV